MPEAQDPAKTAATLAYRAAENGSIALRQRMRAAIDRQARTWGIRSDQAQALLLDRVKVA